MLCDERGLGDAIAKALALVGVTEERVNEWIGDCKCQERRQKLNQLGVWAYRVLSGRTSNAQGYFDAIAHDED